MNGGNSAPPPHDAQSPLSLLVNAADNERNGRLAESLRLRGGLEEQLFLQQHQQQQQQQQGGMSSLLSQLREQNFLSQLGQQQQLASLLGLGGGGGGQHDMRAALAAAQLRQQLPPQLSPTDLMAMSRNPALSNLLLGGGGGGGGVGAGLAARDLEGLQRLEELERRQRLLAAAAAGGAPPPAPHVASRAPMPEPQEEVPPPVAAAAVAAVPPPAPVAEVQPSGAAVAAAGELSKEELEKAPGSVIVPCRARGMPMDHNFKTAYFVIPENVKHGEELICSYFACRNAGIKFRYCSHCKVPVAKRNFRKRHKHGGFRMVGYDSGDEEEVHQGIPSQITASRGEAATDGISSQSADSNQDAKQAGEDLLQQQVRTSMQTFESRKKEPAVAAAPSGAGPQDRESRWMNLLSKRPQTKDDSAMSTWLMEVLAVSDTSTPLDKGDAEMKKPAVPAMAAVPPVAAVPVAAALKDESVGESSSAADFASEMAAKKRYNEDGGHVSGSFAEWKERKRQKKQMMNAAKMDDKPPAPTE